MKLQLKESQNIEFKEIWKDEYLKQICGFANSNGGTLFIEVDDNSNIVGVSNAKKLLEDLPNKTNDILGIIPDVLLEKFEEKEIIKVVVQSQTNPINYKAYYYKRSGATNQLLKGSELSGFLLKHYGKTWDSVEMPHSTIDDLDPITFELFKEKALKSKRIDKNDIPKDYKELLDKLRLIENGHIKRAALLLFGKAHKISTSGAYIKIGYFSSPSDILYQDVIEGNLFNQVEKTVDLLFTKYLKALISYVGVSRVENFDYDENALREAIHNAIVHKDYSSGIPIQIGVFQDKLYIYNSAILPHNWDIDKLLSSHRSEPHNPDIANAFFKAGYIESWGRGIDTIVENSKKYSGKTPTISITSGFDIVFYAKEHKDLSPQVGTKLGLSQDLVEILIKCQEPKAISELMEFSKRTNRTKYRDSVLKPLIEAFYLEPTIPDKPTSSKQKYRLTELGKNILLELGKLK